MANGILISFPDSDSPLRKRKRPLETTSTTRPSPSPTISKGSLTWNTIDGQNKQLGSEFASEYSSLLLGSLIFWIFYLLLPKGFRRHMFNAYPRRHLKSSKNTEILVLGRHSPRQEMTKAIERNRRKHIGSPPSIDSSYSKGVQLANRQDSGIAEARLTLVPSGSSDANSDGSPTSGTGTWGLHDRSFGLSRRVQNDRFDAFSPFRVRNRDDEGEETIDFLSSTKAPSLVDIESLATFSSVTPSVVKNGMYIDPHPSPFHPDTTCNHKVPSEMVLSSTLTSLREPGIRLFAHGTQCMPRRIWIQLNVHQEVIEWRTEDPNKNTPNGVRLGPKHYIPLSDVLFVDVGKTTAALKMLSEQEIRSDFCLSLLTRNGSLDLRAGSKLERDSLVSCFCLILDTLHISNPSGKNWRDLNDTMGDNHSFERDESINGDSSSVSGIMDTSLLSI